MMNPFEQAAALYENDAGQSFDRLLFDHLQHGYVVSTPEAFAMVRVVRRDWPEAWLRDPRRVAAAPEGAELRRQGRREEEKDELAGDCWFIWVLAGKLKVAARWLPFDLPWIGYERRDGAPVFRRAGNFVSACACNVARRSAISAGRARNDECGVAGV